MSLSRTLVLSSSASLLLLLAPALIPGRPQHFGTLQSHNPHTFSLSASVIPFESNSASRGARYLNSSPNPPARKNATQLKTPLRSNEREPSPSVIAGSAREEQLKTARGAVAEAAQLRGEWKETSLRQALDKYQIAWRIFETLGERLEATEAVMQLGEVSSLLGEYREALNYFDQARASSRATRNSTQEIEARNNQGEVYALIGENDKAIALFRSALRLANKIDHRPGIAKSTGGLGIAFYNLSEMNQALDFLQQALPLFDAAVDPQGRAQILRYLGYTYTDMSELSLALDYFQQSLSLWRAAGDLRGEAQTVNAMALVHFLLGEREQAMQHYSRAEQMFRTVGDKKGIITALNGQGETFGDLNLVRALDHHTEALRLSQEIGNLDGQIIAHRYMGNIHRALGDAGDIGKGESERHYQQAIQHYEQALGLCRTLKDRRIESYNLQDLAGIYDFLGATKKGLDHYSRALKLSREVKDPRGEALVLNSIGVI